MTIALGRDAAVHLRSDGSMRPLPLDRSFRDHETRAAELHDGHLLSSFDYTATWPRWERHPTGEELVHLLSGRVDLVLDDGTGDDAVRTVHLGPGDAAVVPQGTWHRAVIHEPARMLFLTPAPAHTEQRPA